MRDAVEIIDGAIERIDHPLKFALLVADDSFFAVERVIREIFQQCMRDQFLRLHIDLEFDVVLLFRVDVARLMKMCAQQIAGLPRRMHRGVEIMFHRGLRRIKLATCTRNFETPS